MNKKTIKNIDCRNKKVFIRVDFNVPQDKITNEITNNQRIIAVLPTIKYALEQNASIVLASHLGRPDGQKIQKYSLRSVAKNLEQLLDRPIRFLEEAVGLKTENICRCLQPSDIILLENLRFYPEEEGKVKNDNGEFIRSTPEQVRAFRSSLTKLADIYINDAFGVSHRAHSSIVGVNMPIKVAGFLMEKELVAFSKIIDHPKTPLLAILGGAKIADKIPLINNLIDKAQKIIVCGGMAYTFLKVLYEMKIGNSLFDPVGAKMVPSIMQKATNKGVEIFFPTDFIIGNTFSPSAICDSVTAKEGIPNNWEGFDIGLLTRQNFDEVIQSVQTIVWNGPPGVFEFNCFSEGTKAMTHSIARATANGSITVIGGGDTATAAKKFVDCSEFTHVSTGGGSSLELLEGKELPGVAILDDLTVVEKSLSYQ